MPNPAIYRFFRDQNCHLTFGDVRLKTHYSEIVPAECGTETLFSRHIRLGIPIVSSPMDTVTGAKMAIGMAKAGGLGIIHRGFSPEVQASEVATVKHHLHGLTKKPITVGKNATIKSILDKKDKKDYRFSTFPVLDRKGRFVGLLTGRDFETCDDTSLTAAKVMTPRARLKVAPATTDAKQAYAILKKSKKNVLPLVDARGKLAGIYVLSDLKRNFSSTRTHNLDPNGQLVVGAAVGVGRQALLRAKLLAAKGCDVFVIDTAHGNSKSVIATVKALKKRYPHIDVVAGNVSTADGAERLVKAGADGIMVGQGPGSICTTRIVAGIGTPQVSAIFECVAAIEKLGVPVCADGGIENSGDIAVALALGAQSVILGKLLAGTDEAPTEKQTVGGRMYKPYRGMGSLGAMRDNATSRARYAQSGVSLAKVVPEGIEGFVDYQGSLGSVLVQLVGGVRSGMGYNGARTIPELQEAAELIRITGAGLAESHPHGIAMIAAAPNYPGRGS